MEAYSIPRHLTRYACLVRRTLAISDFERSRTTLTYSAEIAGRSFTSRFEYSSVDFYKLERRYGHEPLAKLYLHAVAYDLNRLISLRPDRVNFGPFAALVSADLRDLWDQIFQGAWAQWRYENNLPSYAGPSVVSQVAEASLPIRRTDESDGTARTLVFCGGGKDSLLTAKLLESVGEPYDSLAYSHSIYGEAEPQHALIDGLLDHCQPQTRHRLTIEDNFLGAQLDLEEFGVRTLTAAETPSSLFLALPIALAHGFQNLVVGHERSADKGNLVWEATGEEINHQWGKSLEAERLLADYVDRHLLPGVRYWSALKPVGDPVIFSALREYPEAIPATHSCNVDKPWCGRCAKCLYVFLGYCAWLPREVVEKTFQENLFDVPENEELFAQLLGVSGHLPFECVGQVEESRLALALAVRHRWNGIVIRRFAEFTNQRIPEETLDHLFAVGSDHDLIPKRLAPQLRDHLTSLQAQARQSVRI